MTNRLLICYSMFLLVFAYDTANSHILKGSNTTAANYLGSVEGKSYFAQMTPAMTWPEAKTFCQGSGMHLASITSSQQKSLLQRAHNTATFDGFFWTGARDALGPTQFVWDFDKRQVTSVVDNYYECAGILTCLTYHVYSNRYYFDSRSCTQKHGVLCEIIHGH